MTAQMAMIADTIMGMKRALHKENDYSGPDDPITQPTNRGNKLRGDAKYVREGALGYIHPEEHYKQKIEHAGYTRYILQRNPVRYDSEGDELDEEDEDEEADAAAAEENPFSEIALETLLCPLKHPSELPTHPSMSHAYTSKALRTMAQNIEAKLRQERALLWRARNLHRQFLGDSCWMPCGITETPEDRWIFEPKVVNTGRSSSISRYGQSGAATPSLPGASSSKKDGAQESLPGAASRQESNAPQTAEQDVDMMDARNAEAGPEANENNAPTKELKSEEVDPMVEDLPQHPESKDPGSDAQANASNQEKQNQPSRPGEPAEKENPGDEAKYANNDTTTTTDDDHRSVTQEEEDAEMADGSSPEPPRRMTTRAQTNANNPQSSADNNHLPSSPSTETVNTLPTPHPLFLAPDSIRADPTFGLPPNEAEETRRLLWSYIQKQEETVRGFEHMLQSLLQACRMKEDVLEWCKAEGHVGEMSDGEDWYDREKLGLAEGEDLKKGADEDEMETVEESRAAGKRGRGRRA